MGILKSDIELICKQKKITKGLFKGKTLVIGQQSIYANEFECKKIILKHNIKFTDNFKHEKKTNIQSFINENADNINSSFFFTLLGSNNVDHLDVSKYENANIILDLNKKVPNKYKNKFDNIVDFGTIEHVYNTPNLLFNYINMLKKNGFLVILTRSSNSIDHGFFSFSPTFFHDFFPINGFKILNTYLLERSPYYPEKNKNEKIYKYTKTYLENPIVSSKTIDLIIFIKKINNTKNIKTPLQYYYKKLFKIKKIEKKKSYDFKKFIKIIISYLPFFVQRIIFLKIRSKYLLKIKLDN